MEERLGVLPWSPKLRKPGGDDPSKVADYNYQIVRGFGSFVFCTSGKTQCAADPILPPSLVPCMSIETTCRRYKGTRVFASQIYCLPDVNP